jgi:hypothetical protein
MQLGKLYENRGVDTPKGTMIEVEEFARWFVELIAASIKIIKKGKVSLTDYPKFMKILWGAKDAFAGFSKFDDEFRQANYDDYRHLKDSVLKALWDSGANVPTEYIDLLAESAITNFKLYRETRRLLRS